MDVGRQKTEEKLRLSSVARNPFARNGRWTSKTEENCDFELSIATLTHEMDVGRQKLKKNCDFSWSIATLSHEMDFGRQKLRKNSIFLSELQPFRTKWMLDVKN